MKFFAHLVAFRNGNASEPGALLGKVHGPYENEAEAKAAIKQIFPDWQSKRFILFDGMIVDAQSMAAAPEKEKRSRKRSSDPAKHLRDYICGNCGTKTVVDRNSVPAPSSKSSRLAGTYSYKMVARCPKCGLEAPLSDVHHN